jgi:AcrR family transcriptional regulator
MAGGVTVDGATGDAGRVLPARRRVREQRAQRVLEVAARRFADRGYHATAMDDIAREAGVSKPVVYAAFGSKDELYVACLEEAESRLHAKVQRAVLAEPEPEGRMWQGILALLDHIEGERAWWSMLFDDAAVTVPGISAEVAALRASTAGMLSELFMDTAGARGVGGTAMDAVEPLGHAFVGTCTALARWWLHHPEVPKGTVAMYFMNYAWMGLGDLIAGRLWLPGAIEGSR